jgi:hypothetical protein
MVEKLAIKCSNGSNDEIVIRTATGEVGILTADNTIYVRACDVDELCDALQRAVKACEVRIHPVIQNAIKAVLPNVRPS